MLPAPVGSIILKVEQKHETYLNNEEQLEDNGEQENSRHAREETLEENDGDIYIQMRNMCRGNTANRDDHHEKRVLKR